MSIGTVFLICYDLHQDLRLLMSSIVQRTGNINFITKVSKGYMRHDLDTG